MHFILTNIFSRKMNHLGNSLCPPNGEYIIQALLNTEPVFPVQVSIISHVISYSSLFTPANKTNLCSHVCAMFWITQLNFAQRTRLLLYFEHEILPVQHCKRVETNVLLDQREREIDTLMKKIICRQASGVSMVYAPIQSIPTLRMMLYLSKV